MHTLLQSTVKATGLRALALTLSLGAAGATWAQAPASIGALWKINGNGYAGDLLLQQAPDGRLSGTMYGQPVQGYYAPGAGTVVLLRLQGSSPYQMFTGTASPQGLRGDFFPLGPEGGATPSRVRYDWSATLAPALIGPAPAVRTGVALLPALPPAPAPSPTPSPTPAGPAPTPAAPTFTGWVKVRAVAVTVRPLTQASTTAPCPAGKVVTGAVNSGNNQGAGVHVIERAPLPDGSGARFTIVHDNALLPNPVSLGSISDEAICIDRPEGYEIVEASRNLGPGQRAVVDAQCPAGKVLIGGGVRSGREVYTATSAPRADGRAWQGHFRNDLKLPGATSAQVFAICASDRLASAVTLVTSPDTPLSLGNLATTRAMSCAGGRGLAGGTHSSATTITEGGMAYLTNPNPPQTPHSWGAVSIRNADSEQATVGVRALCAAVR